MFLEAHVEPVDATTAFIRLDGRLTLGTRLREVEAKINQVVEGGVRKLVLDLSAVAYADSAGLGLIMLLYGKMKTVQGKLLIAAPNQTLLDLFHVTSTDSILAIYPDREAALTA